jgi:hypothetical protein
MARNCTFESLRSVSKELLSEGITSDTPIGKAYLCSRSKLSLDNLWFFYISDNKDKWLPVTITYWRDNLDAPGDILARTILFFDGVAKFDISSGAIVPTGAYVELVFTRLAVDDYKLFSYTKAIENRASDMNTASVEAVANARVTVNMNGAEIGNLKHYPFNFSVFDDEGYCDYCFADSELHRKVLIEHCTDL